MTTPYEAYMADQMDKAALDPLSMGAAMGLGHLATNAVIKARNAVGDSMSLGGRTFGPRQVAQDAIHDALQGRIASPARREAHKLTLGPEVQGQEYAMPHAVASEYLRRAGGDKDKAVQMMQQSVGTPAFGKAVAGYAPSEHLAEAVRGLDAVKIVPREGTIAFRPGTRAYAAQDAAGKTLAQAGAAAMGVANPHLAAVPILNKAKDLLNRYTPIGSAIAARQAGAGLQRGPLTGGARHLSDLVASPGMTQMRDAGAVVGRGIDRAAPPSVAADVKRRVGETLQSPSGLANAAQSLHGVQEAVAKGRPVKAVRNAEGFYQHLAPESQQAVRDGAAAAASTAAPVAGRIVKKPGVQAGIENVYHAAAGGFDARRAAGEKGLDMGRGVANDVLDATVNKRSPIAVKIPSPAEVEAGRAAFAGHLGPAEAPKTGLGHLAVPAAVGAAAIGAGYATHEPAHHDAYYGYKAAFTTGGFFAELALWAKAAGAMDEEMLAYAPHPVDLGRFDAVPQPLRIRARDVNIAPALTTDEALHRIFASKNHQHHLAKRSLADREAFADGFKQRWVGEEPYDLVNVDLERLRHRRFTVDEGKVQSLMKSPPPDDGNYPIIGRHVGKSGHPHVVLDGNHRVEALLRTGTRSMKAYVSRPVVPELSPYANKLDRLHARRNGLPEPELAKAAYCITVPVDLADRTPSPFPEDFAGHELTSLRATSAGRPELAMLLAAMRGHEGTPAANAALAHYIAGPHLAGLLRR